MLVYSTYVPASVAHFMFPLPPDKMSTGHSTFPGGMTQNFISEVSELSVAPCTYLMCSAINFYH